ncbi:MAG: methionyl-tRNA formyltransferase [Firmicutes bacterium]|nr:methionyl-tRNA formyltransferase [Bacillota bacterium]MBQ2148125.1 methionyl-tRNA formyltransferase [Bacillota bacterium]
MRIVYMGTPDFAVPALEKIVSCGWDVPLVVTKPDRPASRGHKIQQCDVKKKALELGLAVESPEKVKNNPEFAARLREIAPDFIVVAAYGKILPKEILDIPAYGCINIHGSLLPKYRGAAPIQRSVLAGDPESGVTIMYMAEECDAGDMLAQRAIPIAGKTSEQVFDELSVLGADLLVECLPKIVSGELKGVPQDASLATHAAMIAKEEGQIDWDRSAKALESHVLGMYSWPIAFTSLNGEVFKIHAAKAAERRTKAAPGTVVSSGKEGIGVACGDGGVLLLTKVQLPGKKAMDAGAFLLGHTVETGTVLG